MRIQGRFLAEVVFSLLVLFLLLVPFSMAQERAREELVFSLDVVSPLDQETVSGDVILHAAPAFSSRDIQLTVRITSEGGFDETVSLSPDHSLMGAWDSSRVNDGYYSLLFSACSESRCTDISRTIIVDNSSRIVPAREVVPIPPIRSPSDSRDPPDVIPPETPEVEAVTVFPSNVFSLSTVSFSDSPREIVARSSGDPFVLFPDTYDFSLTFPTGLVSSISLTRASIEDDGELVSLAPDVSVDPFRFRGAYYDPVSSISVSFGFLSREQRVILPSIRGLNLFFCSSFDLSVRSCRVTWSPVSRSGDDFSFDVPSSSGVFVFVRQTAPPVDVPLHSVLFSSLRGEFFAMNSLNEELGPFTNDPVSLGEDVYAFRLSFFDAPFSHVRAQDVNVDHTGTFFTGERVDSDVNAGMETWLVNIPYSISPAPFVLSPGFDATRIEYCLVFDSLTSSCVSNWEVVSSPVFSSGVSAWRFFARTTPPDLNVPAFDVPDKNVLGPIIASLKQLHANKRFFFSEDAVSDWNALSSLFSSIEVDLECGSSPTLESVLNAPSLAGKTNDSSRDGPIPRITDGSISPLVSVPSLFLDENDPAFFVNNWEDFVPYFPSWRQRENSLNCDGVSLQNTFSFVGVPPDTEKDLYLGGSTDRIKQSIVLTNNTDSPQLRRVNIRLSSPFPTVSTESASVVSSERYSYVPARRETVSFFDSTDPADDRVAYDIFHDSVLHFVDDAGRTVGSYDVSDFIANGFSPQVVMHRRLDQTVVETVLTVTVLPRETLVLDPVYELSDSSNFHVRWNGFVAADRLGLTNTVTTQTSNLQGFGVQLVNIDNNSYANDLVLVSINADINSKTDAGAVWLVRDIDKMSGAFDLSSTLAYAIRWNGSAASNRIGYPQTVGSGVQVVDLDGNGYTNDLLINGVLANIGGTNGAGVLYTILDVDKNPTNLIQNRDLTGTQYYNGRWIGATLNDNVGYSNQAGQGVQLVNVDNNAFANDLLVSAALGDYSARSNSGIIYLIKDAYKFRGELNFGTTTHRAIAIGGSRASDSIGGPFQSGQGIFLVDSDRNGYTNDLIISCGSCDAPQTNSGAIFYLRDIDKRSGEIDLNSFADYAAVWAPDVANFQVGLTAQSMEGVILADTDGNSILNDIIFSSSTDDSGSSNAGAVYYVRDFNIFSGVRDLNIGRYTSRWVGNAANDGLSSTNGSAPGIQLVNIDGNYVANDLIITSYLHNVGGRTDNGGVFLIKDINLSSGNFDMKTTSHYSVAFYGSRTTDRLGDSNFSRSSVQVVNVDNNAFANDILITASLADGVKANTGRVYLVKDIANKSGNLDFNTITNFSAMWDGGDTGNQLGDMNGAGSGAQLVDSDGNGYANDLLLASIWADVNGKVNSGAIWLIQDVDMKTGVNDLNNSANYRVRWNGGGAGNAIGSTLNSDSGIQLVDLDQNGYTNDLILTNSSSDDGAFNTGSIVVIQDIDSLSGDFDLNNTDSYTKRFNGGSLGDVLGATFNSRSGTQISDTDNNAYVNDFLLTSVMADVNSKANAGAVYLLKDVIVANVVVPDYSFVLNLPSSGCTLGKGNITGGVTCQKGYIESSDLNGLADANQMQPEGQSTSSTIPFFSFDNQSTSSSDLNILLDLNAALPGSLVLKVSTSSSGYQGACAGLPSGCLVLSSSQQNIGKATYSSNAQDLNVYFWADFISASPGAVDRNVDSNGVPS